VEPGRTVSKLSQQTSHHRQHDSVVATLAANNASYTAIIRGVNGTTGIAVVEIYALQ
jgi:hypothetical protein